MPPKALLLLFVFYTVMAIAYSGSVNVQECNACAVGGDILACCKKNGYRTGHCGGIPFISQKGWCDDHV